MLYLKIPFIKYSAKDYLQPKEDHKGQWRVEKEMCEVYLGKAELGKDPVLSWREAYRQGTGFYSSQQLAAPDVISST